MTRFLTLTLFTVGILFAGPKPAYSEIDIGAVLNAIRESHCIGEYWVPSPPRPSVTWPVAVRVEGDVAYAWVERLESKTRWATFYDIASKNGKPVVTSTLGYNTETMQENPGYRDSWNKVFGGDPAKHAFGGDFRLAELQEPFKCTRVFAPDTPTKQAILEAIQKSMAKSLPFSRYAARLPERVRIVIANFNVDDGSTYVVVRETNELYGVLLDNGIPDAPIDRDYIVWEPNNASEAPKIRSKVMATGIERIIQLSK